MHEDTLRRILDELRAMRCELMDLRSLALDTQDQISRCSSCRTGVETRLAFIEQRFSEVIDDQEKKFRAEMMGLSAQFEGEFQARLDDAWKKGAATANPS